jgi:spore coat polysaccharide biosynthesis protein SpsF
MAKVVACIIARTVSTRLPLKVLRHIRPNISMLDFLIQRLKTVNKIDEIYICTSAESVDDILEDVATNNGVKLYRGSTFNIIERMLGAGEKENADVLIRITGDNPLTSVEYLNFQIESLLEQQLDYCRLVDVPIGATAEVMTVKALKKCALNMESKYSEYLMLYMFQPNQFKCGVIAPLEKNSSDLAITIDTSNDFDKIRNAVAQLYKENECLDLKSLVDYLRVTEKEKKQVNLSAEIKLPGNKTISFGLFHKDMEERKNSALNIKYEG